MRWRRPGRPADPEERSDRGDLVRRPAPWASLKARIERDGDFIDSYIDSHGFAPHLRDYDVVIDVPAPIPGWRGRRSRTSYIAERIRYRFTHVPEVRVTTAYPDGDRWDDEETWDDRSINYEALVTRLGNAKVVWHDLEHAYPGLSYVADSPLAAAWSERFGRPMHEVLVEGSVLVHRIVCHNLVVRRLAVGDPKTGDLRPV